MFKKLGPVAGESEQIRLGMKEDAPRTPDSTANMGSEPNYVVCRGGAAVYEGERVVRRQSYRAITVASFHPRMFN